MELDQNHNHFYHRITMEFYVQKKEGVGGVPEYLLLYNY